MGQTTVGFIGFGNMAQAMAKGFVTRGALPGEAISACAKHWDKPVSYTHLTLPTKLEV